MRFRPVEPPRKFKVSDSITLRDCGTVELSADEQVTFKAEGTEYDFCRKTWGYYASPSLNSRMGRFGLRPALVKNPLNGAFFMMAVLKNRLADFETYLARTNQRLLAWLDDDAVLESLAPARRCLCGGGIFNVVFHYSAPPPGEILFEFSRGSYRRDILRCSACGHFLSVHAMDMAGMYGQDYVDSTYGGSLAEAFARIVTLPAGQSDNAGRVAFLTAFAGRWFPKESGKHSILDVGSGLCVFLHCMKKEGWECTALDPDPRAARHAHETAGVAAIAADFMETRELGRFDVVSFNKVLEHTREPIAMLSRARRHLSPGGFVFVELPDGEGAVADGPGREEFFIEHHHIFSAASFAVLAQRAGFRLIEMQRLREPSGKFTLRGFLNAGASDISMGENSTWS